MWNRHNRARRATAVPGVEEHKRLRRWSRQDVSNNRQTDHDGTDGQERACIPTKGKMERNASFHICADQIVPEKRLTSIETAPVAPLSSKNV